MVISVLKESNGIHCTGDVIQICKQTKFWWGEDQAEHGAIYSSIDGTGDPRPMTEVDNSSRIIKYVVLRSDRYSGNAMPGLRIHDINLVCDLNAHDPTVVNPYDVMYDGTDDGDFEGDGDKTALSHFPQLYDIALLLSNVVGWWTGPWPQFHVSFAKSSNDGPSFSLHMSVDLLCVMQIESMNFDMGVPDDPTTSTSFFENLEANSIEDFWEEWQYTIAAILTGFITTKLCRMSTISLGHAVVAAASIALYCYLVIQDLCRAFNRALENFENPIERFMYVFVKGLLALFGFGILSLLLPYGFLKLRGLAKGYGVWINGHNDMHWAFIGVKFALSILTFVLACAVIGFSLLDMIM